MAKPLNSHQIHPKWKGLTAVEQVTKIDLMCIKARTNLGDPLTTLPNLDPLYETKANQQILNFSKFLRKVDTLYRLKNFSRKNGIMMLGVEYFQKNIQLNRLAGDPISDEFKDEFFFKEMIQTSFSLADILSAMALKHLGDQITEPTGFNYSTINSIRLIEGIWGQSLLDLFNKPDTKYMKSLRNNLTHFEYNLQALAPLIEKAPQQTTITRPKEFKFRTASLQLFQFYTDLITLFDKFCTTISANQYETPSDDLWVKGNDGYFKTFTGTR